MVLEVRESDANAKDDDDLLDAQTAGLNSKLPAPTTHKRVGRSMRHPPGPSVDDGPSDSALSTAEIPEDRETSIIEQVRESLQTRAGLNNMYHWLGEEPAQLPSDADIQNLDRLVEILLLDGTFDTVVFVVPKDQEKTLQLPDDRSQTVRIGMREHAVWASGGKQRAIAISDSLPVDVRVDEVRRLLADEIEATAFENKIKLRPGNVLKWLRSIVHKTDVTWNSAFN